MKIKFLKLNWKLLPNAYLLYVIFFVFKICDMVDFGQDPKFETQSAHSLKQIEKEKYIKKNS